MQYFGDDPASRRPDPGQNFRIRHHCETAGGMFVSRIAQKVTGDLADIFREGYIDLAETEVIRFWRCCHLANTTKKLAWRWQTFAVSDCRCSLYLLVLVLSSCWLVLV